MVHTFGIGDGSIWANVEVGYVKTTQLATQRFLCC